MNIYFITANILYTKNEYYFYENDSEKLFSDLIKQSYYLGSFGEVGGGVVIIIMNNIHCFQSQHSSSMMKREININWVLINIFTVSTNMRIN